MKSYTSFLKNIIYIIFIYLVIFLMSFILASFNFFNHKNKEIKYDDIEIYLLENIYLEAKMEEEIYFVNLNNEGIFSIV